QTWQGRGALTSPFCSGPRAMGESAPKRSQTATSYKKVPDPKRMNVVVGLLALMTTVFQFSPTYTVSPGTVSLVGCQNVPEGRNSRLCPAAMAARMAVLSLLTPLQVAPYFLMLT